MRLMLCAASTTPTSDKTRKVARQLLSDDLTFTSPEDDHIDKASYMARCFPTVSRFVWTDLREPVEAQPGLVIWRYAYELHDGGRFSNVEEITVRNDQFVTIRVYFGGSEK